MHSYNARERIAMMVGLGLVERAVTTLPWPVYHIWLRGVNTHLLWFGLLLYFVGFVGSFYTHDLHPLSSIGTWDMFYLILFRIYPKLCLLLEYYDCRCKGSDGLVMYVLCE